MRIATPFEALPGAMTHAVLGRVRTCPMCRRRWPWTSEFFYVVKLRVDGSPVLNRRCRSCVLSHRATRHRRTTAGTVRVILGPCPCQGCREPLTWNGWGWEEVTGYRHVCGVVA